MLQPAALVISACGDLGPGLRRDERKGEAAAFPLGCAATLDRHLDPGSAAPLVVALSGGGDSVALLALTAEWAQRHGRRVLALTVDHGLHPESGAWARFAAHTAARLGAEHRTLHWRGAKPDHGLPAAARRARHALLAEAAREAGARVILLGHTADDRLEEALMRAEGVPLGRLRPWAPSPAWPEGRGVFLLRPLLDVRRAALRAWLAARGPPWVEDPANADPRFARARVRGASERAADPPPAEGARRSPLLDAAETTVDGRIVLPRANLLGAPDAARFTAAAVACASGTPTGARTDRVAALLRRLTEPGRLSGTLGGARVEASADQVAFGREPGRQGLADVALEGRPVVWDGRFEAIGAAHAGRITALRGLTSSLPPSQRRALARAPAWARGVLPVVVSDGGAVSCPLLEAEPACGLRTLVADRLQAALGGVVREP